MEQKNERKNRKGKSRKQQKRKKIRRFLMAASLALTGLVSYSMGNYFAISRKEPAKANVSAVKVYESGGLKKTVKMGAQTNERTAQNKQQGQQEQEQMAMQAKEIYKNAQALLVLVNKDRGLSDSYNANLSYICKKRLQASRSLKEDLTEMLSKGQEAGYSFWIASAWRSSSRQQALLEAEIKKNKKNGMSEKEARNKSLETVMPAGHSEHETGLALDILCSDNLNMDETQETAAGNIWLREHCAEYGFVLRYPKEKVEITQIAYEPWHFRYVGREAAAFMHENNLTLEEFYDLAEE